MNKLDYCISLREKGFASNEIKKRMKEKGFEESEILYYLKRSDEIFLNQLIRNNKKSKPQRKYSKGLKIIVLALSLILLVGVIFGYLRIGLLGIFILWSLVGFSKFR